MCSKAQNVPLVTEWQELAVADVLQFKGCGLSANQIACEPGGLVLK